MDNIQYPIQVTRSSMPSLQEYTNEIASLWNTHWLTNMGEKHKLFEKQLCEYLDTNNIALYTNGHSALECALEVLELKGKVITTPFSFASTTHAISRKGLEPVFADINPETFTIDPKCIEQLIDEETCAILPVHVYGNVCDVDAIQAIADKYNLKVIYDAAHAFGVKKDGISVANYGDFSMFSFHATKVFNTIEGGALTFKNPDYKEKLNQWKNFGITGQESVEYIGGNSKMNEFCAAMGICNLRHIDEEISKRKHVFGVYSELLGSIKGITIPRQKKKIQSNYAYYPVLFEDEFGATRDKVFEKLKENGIFSRKYFYPLISNFECYRDKFDSSKTPNAVYVSNRVLTLPMYADLSDNAIIEICKTIKKCKK